MRSDATSPQEYLSALPEDRKEAVSRIRQALLDNLPKGFEERIINLASQKNFIALYHMGIYSDPELLLWFQDRYADLNIGKLDMGKSCMRFKRMDRIPFELIGELASKMSPQDWIGRYEAARKK